jgi:hypothetical protein
MNSPRPISAQAAQEHRESGACPRPRWKICRNALGVMANWGWVRLLLLCVTDNLHGGPSVSIPLPHQVLDDGERGETPTSLQTGRTGQWPALPSGGHEIGPPPINSPNLISRLVSYQPLSTWTADDEDNGTRSRWWGVVQFNWAGWWASPVYKDAKTRIERAWSDLWRAGRGEVFFAVAETWFGGSLKFKSSGEQLLAIFGGWVGDDLAGLAGGSIYREQERRPGILTVTRGDQRKKKSTGARESVASIVAVTPTSHEEAQGFTVMRWRA